MNDPSDSRRTVNAEVGIAECDAEQSSPPSDFDVEVIVEGKGWSVFEGATAYVLRAASAVSSHLEDDLRGKSAAIALSSDARVAELNSAYRGKQAPTNVLSFPAAPTPALAAEGPNAVNEPVFIGDIILAAETVEREASELRRPPAHHLQHLVVHGLLHLLGYDHETDEDARIMEGLETKILEHIDVPDPHSFDDQAIEQQHG